MRGTHEERGNDGGLCLIPCGGLHKPQSDNGWDRKKIEDGETKGSLETTKQGSMKTNSCSSFIQEYITRST
jgi:hypothetical protein